MNSKLNFLNSLLAALVFLLILPLSLQAQDKTIEQKIKERGEKTQVTYTAVLKKGAKKWQFLSTGGSSMGDMASIAIKRSKDMIIELSPADFKKFMALKRAGKAFTVIDKLSTGVKLYESVENEDYVGIGEHTLNHVGSGAAVKVGIFIAAAAGASNPITLLIVGVGSAGAYSEYIEPMLHDNIFDPLRDELNPKKDKKERVPYVPTEEEKRKSREWRIKTCKEEIRLYKETKKRPPPIMYNLCKKYGIDIYDLCPDDPSKTEPGVCGCNKPDIDSDGDRVYTCQGDECDDNPELTKKGKYGEDGCQRKEDWMEEQLEGIHCPKNSFPQWNSKTNKPGCVCIEGMKSDKSTGKCVDENEDNNILTCKDIVGAQIIYLPGNRYGCDCKYPLVWADNKEQKCVTCDERYPGSIPAKTKEGCACPNYTKWNPNTNRCDTNGVEKYIAPSIMNLSTVGAQSVLQKRGLNLGTLKWGKLASNKEQVGTIVKQHPVRGQPINPGGKVDAWIYYTVVPAVVGKFVKDAVPAMNAAWFKPRKGREIEIDNKYRWNTIASQSLNAGDMKQNIDIPVTLDVYIKPKPKKTVSHPLIGRWEGYIKQGKMPKRAFYWEITSISNDGKFYGVSGAKGKTIKLNGILKGTKVTVTSIEHHNGSVYKNVLNATLNKQNMTIKGNVTPYMDNKNMLRKGFRIIVYLKKKR